MKIINFLLELIYPNVCGFCGEVDKSSLCSSCRKRLKKQMVGHVIKIEHMRFEKLAYIFKYDRKIRKMLLDYKFENQSYLFRTFVRAIIENKKICSYIHDYDCIIAVPIHKKRFAKRGYNQSFLIAKEISDMLNIPCYKNVLLKIKNNKKQSELNKDEREENVKNVYSVVMNEKINGKKVLLVDDIYTTGNTLNECASMLKNAGAKEIGTLVVAKG